MPRRDVPSPSAAGPPMRPRIEDEPRATAAESSPVPSAARVLLEEHVNGGMDAYNTAVAMERVLTDTKDEPMPVASDWRVSARRALVHALRAAPSELRSELHRYQDERSRFETAAVTSAISADELARIARLADRYPNAGFALALWGRLDRERSQELHEPVDTAASYTPLGPDGIHFGALAIKSDGEDGLAAKDADNNTVWEYRARASGGEPPIIRVIGMLLDRLVIVELHKSEGVIVTGIDATTGSERFRLALPDVKDPPQATLVGPDLVLAVPQRLWAVDALRGTLAWERGHARKTLPLVITHDRVVYGPESTGFDLATGREVQGEAGKPHGKQGAIEVR